MAAPTLYTMTLNDAGTLLSSVRTEYDVAGRVLYSVDEAGGLTEFGYDGLGRRTSVKRYVSYVVPTPIETSTIAPPGNATASVTSYGYDESGNQVLATDGNGRATNYEYDRLNRQRVVIYPAVGGAERKRTVTDYDGLGRRVMEWDEAGIATAFGYDALGRLTSVTNDFQAVDTEQEKNTPAATHYVYDEVGNMTKEVRLTYTVDTDGYLYHLPQGLEENVGRTTIYEYDKVGRRVRRFLPGASLDDVSSNSGLEKVTYTELGSGAAKTLRKDVRDFRGKTIGYSYDAMDRLVTKSLPQVTSGVDVARTVSYSYTGGLLTQVSETGSGVARTNYYAYDTASRLRKKDTPEGVLTYTYNARGQVERTKGFRRATVTVNMEVGGAVPEVDVEYGYDALGRLATVKDWKQGGANVSTNYYDLAGVLTETSYPNTIRQRFDHTEQNRLSKVTWEQNTGTAMVAKKRFAYGLNATGQRVQVDEDDGAPAVSRTGTDDRRQMDYSWCLT